MVSELGLGSTSICAALLHDVIEDTEFTREDIENSFGKKIADIVEGLTKISGGIFGDRASIQAENFRKLLLSMSSDIRVVLIKMADRLHNMRTLGSMRPEKQYKIAGETLYVYAPLAHRLGLFKIKTELEDLAFKYEHPQAYEWITSKLDQTASHREKIVEEFVKPVREKLDEAGFKYEIKARVKSAYSIFNKMETKTCRLRKSTTFMPSGSFSRTTTILRRKSAAGKSIRFSPTAIASIPTDCATGPASPRPMATGLSTSRQWDLKGNG